MPKTRTLFFWPIEHGSAAILRAAVACVSLALLFFGFAVDREAVIVIEFLSRVNGAHGVDEYTAIVFFNRLAVRVTAVIDPARIVTVDAGIDDFAVVQTENECVVGIVRVTRRALQRFFPARAFALVLDDAGTFADLPIGKGTMAMGR